MLRSSVLLRNANSKLSTVAAPPPPPTNIPTILVPKPRPGRAWAPAAGKMGGANSSKSPAAAAAPLLPFVPKASSASAAAHFANGTSTFRETEAAVHHYEAKTKPYLNGWYHVPETDYALANGGVSPVMSATQAQILRDVHHAAVVRSLNDLTLGTPYEGHPLDAVIVHTSFDAENAALHSAACEHWNFCMMWRTMLPFGAAPSGRLRHALTTSTIKQHSAPVLLDARHDSAAQRAAALAQLTDGVDRCKRMLSDACRDAAASGGGWVYLCTTQAGQAFDVLRFRPGLSPVTAQLVPMVCINMQHHARYVDYGLPASAAEESASVQSYIDNALRAINWKVAESFWLRASNAASGGDAEDSA